MKTIEITVEPTYKAPRNLNITLGNIQCSASIDIMDKDNKNVVQQGIIVQIGTQVQYNNGDTETPELVEARRIMADQIETGVANAIAEFYAVAGKLS